MESENMSGAWKPMVLNIGVSYDHVGSISSAVIVDKNLVELPSYLGEVHKARQNVKILP